jgi:hypothetical protein
MTLRADQTGLRCVVMDAPRRRQDVKGVSLNAEIGANRRRHPA